jgi:hypothetical protein
LKGAAGGGHWAHHRAYAEEQTWVDAATCHVAATFVGDDVKHQSRSHAF